MVEQQQQLQQQQLELIGLFKFSIGSFSSFQQENRINNFLFYNSIVVVAIYFFNPYSAILLCPLLDIFSLLYKYQVILSLYCVVLFKKGDGS